MSLSRASHGSATSFGPKGRAQTSGPEPAPAYHAACGNHRDNALVAKRAGAKTLVLVHLLAQIDQPGIREQIVHEIQEVYTVIWGEELMKLDVVNAKVTTIEPKQGAV